MADSSTSLHEPVEELDNETRDLHRAVVSLTEELEAVDWYNQRRRACSDAELGAILDHNMREEIEHAAMLLEWVRRRHPAFDAHLRHYLFTGGDITDLEDEDDDDAAPGPTDLGIGSLRETG